VSDEHDEVADVLRRVKDEARREARRAGPNPGTTVPAPARPTETSSETASTPQERESPPAPDPPDPAAVNATWAAEVPPRRGLAGLLEGLLGRVLRPRFEAQRAFNARQVQLDNEILRYVTSRSEATHRHYDHLLGDLGRRLDEADARHAILERELLGHIQDLVQRIDLVLAESSRGRLSLQLSLEEVRERLVRLEDTLRRPE
jgi:hypothetical protein